MYKGYKNVTVFDHPLIQHKVGVLRNIETGHKEFRELVSEITLLMAYEATRDMPMKDQDIETPICKTTVKRIAGKKPAVIPILRAGLGMLDSMVTLIPACKIGHIGLSRDEETHEPHEYYKKLPHDMDQREAYIVDPMLATGGSAIDAINVIRRENPKKIKFLCIIAAPEGIKALSTACPDVEIFCAAVDDCLNENAYIVPGLGDAGDRIYGTRV